MEDGTVRLSIVCLLTMRHWYGPWAGRVQANGWIRRQRRCYRCFAVDVEWIPGPGAEGWTGRFPS